VTDTTAKPALSAESTAFTVLFALSFCHMLNDVMQSLIAAIYPMLKEDYGLSFWQIGLLTMAFQVTASVLQPLVGFMPTSGRCPIRWPSAWGRPCSACCCWALPRNTRCCWPARR
jgi:MFS transporter, FSR family, fosmidomycin resistance protein